MRTLSKSDLCATQLYHRSDTLAYKSVSFTDPGSQVTHNNEEVQPGAPLIKPCHPHSTYPTKL